MNWKSDLSYYSICFHFTKRVNFRNTQNYIWIILLLAGDVELNPGPFNYQLHHPNLCGYHRAAIFFILNRKKMIPTQDDGNDISW